MKIVVKKTTLFPILPRRQQIFFFSLSTFPNFLLPLHPEKEIGLPASLDARESGESPEQYLLL